MSSFTSELKVSPLPNGRDWKLCKSFTYHIGSKNSRHFIKVPKGFVTDFASVPSFLWWWIPPFGKYLKATVLHDWLYQVHFNYAYDRKYADQVFKEAMIVGGTPEWKARLMYYGVRLFGWVAWH